VWLVLLALLRTVFYTGKVSPTRWKASDKTFPYPPLRPGWLLSNEHQLLMRTSICVMFALHYYPEKLIQKFCNSEGCNLGCCFGIFLISELLVAHPRDRIVAGNFSASIPAAFSGLGED